MSDEKKAALVARIVRGDLTPREACEREGLSELELLQWVRTYARAARRAVDDQLAAALAAHGLEVDELPATEFSGNLDEMGIAELIQTVQFGKKDAQIRIDHDGEQSQLWCVGGDVVDAVSARLSGAPAVYRMLGLTRGRVHADFSPVQRARTIHASTQALLLEAAKRSDECAQIRARLGDTLNVYVPSASAPSDSEIEPEQGEVLRAFDGARSVEDVVHDSELPDLETLCIVEQLLSQQWLVLGPFAARREARAPAPAAGAALVSVLGDGSFTPLAGSARAYGSMLDPRRRLWASAGAGVAVVAAAFGIGFYSAPSPDAPRAAVGAQQATRLAPTCGPSLAPLPGGVCLDRAEVSAGEYQVCVRAGVCQPAQRELEPAVAAEPVSAGGSNVNASAASGSANAAGAALEAAAVTPRPPGALATPFAALATARCNGGLAGREAYPVNCVTFEQAQSYCAWRGGRLPSRSEWEFAATSGGSVPALALADGVSEWAVEPAPSRAGGADRERAVVIGGGLDSGAGASLSRLYMNANAQGRSVGFRCVVAQDGAVRGATSE